MPKNIKNSNPILFCDDSIDWNKPSLDRPRYIDLEDGTRIFVDEKTYRDYIHDYWNESKREERSIKRGDLSLDKASDDYDLDLAVDYYTPEDYSNDQELWSEYFEFLGQIPKEDAFILDCLFRFGMTEREVSRILGKSKTTIHYKKNKYLKKLQESLKNFKNL